MRKELQQKLDASRELLHDATSEQRRLAAALARSEERLAAMSEQEAAQGAADERIAAAQADADQRVLAARVCLASIFSLPCLVSPLLRNVNLRFGFSCLPFCSAMLKLELLLLKYGNFQQFD